MYIFVSDFTHEVAIWVALISNAIMVALFTARIYDRNRLEKQIGLGLQAMIIPTIYLVIVFIQNGEPLWMIIYFFIYIGFLFFELLIDYIFSLDFRNRKQIVIPYVIWYYLAFWGLIGISFTYSLIAGFIVFGLFAIQTVLAITARRMGKE